MWIWVFYKQVIFSILGNYKLILNYSPITVDSSPSMPGRANAQLGIPQTPAVSDQFVKLGVSTHPIPLDLPQWQIFPRGVHNAITDVPGIQVGQFTYKQDNPERIRTGVTAIVPDAEALTSGKGNLATTGFRASSVCLNGNGELTGSSFINEFGVLNGPILLSNTRAVGALHSGVNNYFEKYFPGQWSCQLPVIGECYDGFFNTISKEVIPSSAAETVIQQAKSGPVLQGRVGAGTGMRSFELHAGIGSSSRTVVVGGKEYTIGILVNMNHSKLNDMNPAIRQELERRFGPVSQMKAKDDQDCAHPAPTNSPRQGSIQVVIATDLPLNNKQLEELARRAGLGIGDTGSSMSTTSGDFVTAFSTANPVPMGVNVSPLQISVDLHPDAMTSLYKATVEGVVEAQINALVASHS
jgi:D-aminopeptidase